MLSKQFISANITELIENSWHLVITYSYFSLYQYTEAFVYPKLEDAINKLAVERCGGALRITDCKSLNITIGTIGLTTLHSLTPKP